MSGPNERTQPPGSCWARGDIYRVNADRLNRVVAAAAALGVSITDINNALAPATTEEPS